jgi:hypothetical protein
MLALGAWNVVEDYRFFYALCYLWAVFHATSYATTYHIIGLLLFLPGIVGLFLFAFNKRFLSERFWRSFTAVYLGYVAVGLLLNAKTVIVAHGIGTYVIGVAISFVFQFPVVLSLWRLSFATIQSGARHFGETAAP